MKIALFSDFSAGSDIKTKVFQFLIFGEIEISSKKAYNINSWDCRENLGFFYARKSF